MKTRHLLEKEKKDASSMEFKRIEARKELERYEMSKLRMAEHALHTCQGFRSALANSALRSEMVRLDDESGSPRTLMKQ